MKSEKSRLTRIITTLKEKIPEGNDLWGYPGINKAMIMESLNQSYSYIGLLDDYEDQMEVIWAKRRLAKYFDDISKLIEKIGSEKWIEDFDNFLERITKLRILVKDIYITLTDNPIRIDAEIQVARDQLVELTEKSKGIDEKIAQIDIGSAKSIEVIAEIDKNSIALKDLLDETTELKAENDSIEEKIDGLLGKMNTAIPEIDLRLKTIKELQKDQETNNVSAEKLLSSINSDEEKLKVITTEIEQQIKKDQTLQEAISQTLEDVNKYGMASAFLKRKKELGRTLGIWGVLSVISMTVLIIVSYIIASEMIKVSDFDPIRNLFKIPSVIAGVWLCWFCVKQYGYTTRIREDYSYKCAISMAFEGYKNETREVNEDLLDKLLQITISSIAINPVMLFDTRSNHGSPWNEWMDGVKKILKIDVKADAKIGL